LRKSLIVAYANVNSLRAHFETVETVLSDQKIHVFAITETWLTPLMPNECVNICNYSFLRKDRSIKSSINSRYIQGGGVDCYVHSTLIAKVLDSSSGDDISSPEFLILNITSRNSTRNSSPMLVAVIYCRPGGLMFTEFIQKLQQYSSNYTNIIVMGDLNCNLLENSFESQFLRNFISEHSLFLVPHSATHHTRFSDTQIDVIITDAEHKVTEFSQSDVPFAVGHDLLKITYKFRRDDPPVNIKTARNFKDCDFSLLNADILNVLATTTYFTQTSEYSNPSTNDVLSIFNDAILSALGRHASLRTITTVRPPTPWLSDSIKLQIKNRDRAYRITRRTGSQRLFDEYRALRSRLKILMRNAKEEYMSKSVANMTEPVKIWAFLRRNLSHDPNLPCNTSPHLNSMSITLPSRQRILLAPTSHSLPFYLIGHPLLHQPSLLLPCLPNRSSTPYEDRCQRPRAVASTEYN
ncbi:hypothetical protein ALC62_02175, partial [Cyphomyrmex costatus]